MVVAGISRICVHHPDRAGFAACMSCRQVVCQECATTRDGINFCRPCLAAQHRTTGEVGRWRAMVGVLVQVTALATLFVLTSWLMVWAVATLAGWR
jgi:hypothetical protein